jgi:hypothetical protein
VPPVHMYLVVFMMLNSTLHRIVPQPLLHYHCRLWKIPINSLYKKEKT